MKAMIKGNEIVIQNHEFSPEDELFNRILDAMRDDSRIHSISKKMGPSEDLVTAECNSDEIILVYDIDYGLEPIRCTENNIDIVFDIVKEALRYEA